MNKSAGKNGGIKTLAPAADGYGSAVRGLDEAAVKSAYARWAPIYDWLFGLVFEDGRRKAVAITNARSGSVLEVGVGTGLTLPQYGPHLEITGIDLSPDMLAVAHRRVAEGTNARIAGLHEMDASHLTFPDAAFDTTVVMYTITVVPDPDKVMAEIERVTRPGGEVIVVSHFASTVPWRARIENTIARWGHRLGWRSDVPMDIILRRPGLQLIGSEQVGILGLFTVARLKRV
jgi:phosphatidylethanolamine/phosphatidyl-N-methylethanolamine N-methyltransferase